jgi:catechol 2,3-dioxygenase-like lactoylglutathione lyase family enzyme
MALIDHLDHLVVTCIDVEATKRFYVDVLQMRLESFGAGRISFHFGNQKINVHVRGAEFEPKAHLPVPGALELPDRRRAGGTHRRHPENPFGLHPRSGFEPHRNLRTHLSGPR